MRTFFCHPLPLYTDIYVVRGDDRRSSAPSNRIIKFMNIPRIPLNYTALGYLERTNQNNLSSKDLAKINLQNQKLFFFTCQLQMIRVID